MDKELNPTKGESELDEDLNLDEEDSEDEELDFDEDLDEDDEEESEEKSDDEASEEDVKKALQILNKEMQKRGLNKNYTNFEDVVTSEKAKDDAFSQKKVPMDKEKEEGQEGQGQDGGQAPKTEQQQTVSPAVTERLLKLEHPESAYILDEIKRDHPGKDVLDIYESSSYYKKEAAVRAEAEKAKSRISNPSGGVEGSKERTLIDKIEAEFMDESSLPPGFNFLPKGKK